MLKKRTLFVVGAGASIPLGFPSGEALVRGIAQKLRFETDSFGQVQGDKRLIRAIQQASKENSESANLYFDAASEMSEGIGLADSIDRYVDAHSNKPFFSRVAKLCIALFILDAETKAISKFTGDAGSYRSQNIARDYWMSSFCRLHFAGFKADRLDAVFDKVAFLSFNYDRCIRHSLTIGLAKHFRLQDDQAVELSSTAKIVHPYGSLGSLSQYGNQTATYLPYGTEVNQSTLLAASKSIRTFTEGPDTISFDAEMTSLMDWCEDVVFLGFGFAGPNLSIVGNSNKLGRSRRLFGTAFGMKKPNVDFLDQILPQQFTAHGARPLRIDLTAENLLDEYSLELFN